MTEIRIETLVSRYKYVKAKMLGKFENAVFLIIVPLNAAPLLLFRSLLMLIKMQFETKLNNFHDLVTRIICHILRSFCLQANEKQSTCH